MGVLCLYCVILAYNDRQADDLFAGFAFIIHIAFAVGFGVLGLISFAVWSAREAYVYEVVAEHSPAQRVTSDRRAAAVDAWTAEARRTLHSHGATTDPSTTQPEPDR